MTSSVTSGDLVTAYETWGDQTKPPIILLHGFPDDATEWAVVAEVLSNEYWVLAPYARAIGPTRFQRAETPRSGQLAAHAADVVAFADALYLGQFVLVGRDWGQRAAQSVAALHPERVSLLVSIGDYALTVQRDSKPSLKQLLAFRFQLLMNTPLAVPLLRYFRRPLFRSLWRSWSPKAKFDRDVFEGVAPSFDNPDFQSVVLSTYRQYSGKGATDPAYARNEEILSAGPDITVSSTVIRSTQDGIDLYDPEHATPSPQFKALRSMTTINAGHTPSREKPKELADIIRDSIHKNG